MIGKLTRINQHKHNLKSALLSEFNAYHEIVQEFLKENLKQDENFLTNCKDYPALKRQFLVYLNPKEHIIKETPKVLLDGLSQIYNTDGEEQQKAIANFKILLFAEFGKLKNES